MAEHQLQVPLLYRHARIVWWRQAAHALHRRLLHHARRDRGVEPRSKGGGELQDAGPRIVLCDGLKRGVGAEEGLGKPGKQPGNAQELAARRTAGAVPWTAVCSLQG